MAIPDLDILPENRLPKFYKQNSYDYEIAQRVNDVVIAKQSFEGKLLAYEVFVVKKSPAQNLNGYDYPARETVPGSSQWGILGFTVWSMEKATDKMMELLRRGENENSDQN